MTRHNYTKEEDEFLRNYVPGHTIKETIEEFKNRFNIELNENQISNKAKRLNVKTGSTGRFKKGHKAWNKGKEFIVGVKPVGTERIENGYVMIKVGKNKYKRKSRVIWEREHGEIPKGHIILFLDSDKMNTDINNMILVSRAELALINKYNLITSNPELTKLGILYVRLHLKIKERMKDAYMD